MHSRLLRHFLAVIDHGRISAAAEAVHISQPALTKSIHQLETSLGVPLFERRHTELRLTPAGPRYLQSVRQAFDIVDEATTSILTEPVQPKVTLCSYATFAHFWLMPRLSRFRQRYPDVQVDFLTSVASIEFRKDQADLIVTHGIAKPEGVISQRIFGDVLAPVCSPSFLEKNKPLSDPADLKKLTLLHSRYRPNDWGEWFAGVGVELDSLSDAISFAVAPALILYLWSLQTLGRFGWMIALIHALFCALRLARFNADGTSSECHRAGFVVPTTGTMSAYWRPKKKIMLTSKKDRTICQPILNRSWSAAR